jgi:methionyl-tRNA formyltransferase
MLSENSGSASLTHPRIVFMGTPDFAVASLDALLLAGYRIVAVITAPDKPAGRGMQLTESAVKKYATEKGLKILQPEKLKNPQFLEELRSLDADLQVVVAFRMLPELVWNMPPQGTINLHGSLLPQYRGAAPINWAVINGEKQTGVTTFKLQHDIDTGNILLQEAFPIGDQETAGEVHDHMKEIGARLLVRTIRELEAGTLIEIPQSGPALRHAPKIFTETGKIDWNKPVSEIYNLIRGLSPFPGAFTYLDGKLLKIYRAGKEIGPPLASPGQSSTVSSHPAPGEYATDKKTYLKFVCPDGLISLEEIQLEGKKKMKIGDFLRGYKFG